MSRDATPAHPATMIGRLPERKDDLAQQVAAMITKALETGEPPEPYVGGGSDYGNEPERYPWEQRTSPVPGEPPMIGSGNSAVVEYLRAELRKATTPSPVPAGTEREAALRAFGEACEAQGVRPYKSGGLWKIELAADEQRDQIGPVVDAVMAALAAVVSSSPATPEGGRVALQERVAAALALCHRADYGGDDWPYPDHYVPASRIRDALTDIDPPEGGRDDEAFS